MVNRDVHFNIAKRVNAVFITKKLKYLRWYYVN